MPRGKQAKILLPTQERAILAAIESHRRPTRDRAIFLLSAKAGLRAKEIACLEWSMITTPDGSIDNRIELPDVASKGKGGGREIPLHKDLKKALEKLQAECDVRQGPIIQSERGGRMSAASVVNWFYTLYEKLGMDGCSSHSGRRTFVTRAARAAVSAGGSLRDVQQLVGHSNLTTTQKYIEGDSAAKRKIVEMV